MSAKQRKLPEEISVVEAAELMGVSRTVIYELCSHGLIEWRPLNPSPLVKQSPKRIKSASVVALMERSTRTTPDMTHERFLEKLRSA